MRSWKAFLIGCLVAGSLFGPVEAQLRAQAVTPPTSGNTKMGADYDFSAGASGKLAPKINLRLAIRAAMLRGKIDRSQGNKALDLIGNRVQGPVLFEELAALRASQVAEGDTPIIDGIVKLLDWVVANWDTIYAIIKAIMDLFVADLLRRFRWVGDRWLLAGVFEYLG